MKKLLFIFLATTLCGCGPSKEEKAKLAKEEQARVETLARQKADSIANVEREKLRKEAEERQRKEAEERRRMEEAREAEEARRRASVWMGAESVEELAQIIEGTTWSTKEPIARYGGLIYKFEFSNGVVKKYHTLASDGGWKNDYIAFPYEIKQRRDSNGVPFAAIYFGDGSDLDHVNQCIAFIGKHCTRAVWFIEGNPAAELKFGDFKWDNEL